MNLRLDYDTLALMLDLPDDMTITGAVDDGGSVLLVVDAPDTYPENGTPIYAMDDEQNVVLLTIEDSSQTDE